MKSSLFPHKKAAAGYRNRSAAGPTSGNGNSAPNTDGYKTGMAGDRAGRSAGGKTMGSHVNAPKANAPIRGDGGFAWDSSMPNLSAE